MPTSRRTSKFLECIPKTLRSQIEAEEQQFLLQALELRKELVQAILSLLENPKVHSIKDLASALKVIQDQISSSKKEIALLTESEKETVEELADLDLPEISLPSQEILKS